MPRSRLELELAPLFMTAMLIRRLYALMAIMAIIHMPVRRTGTTDRRGSRAGCLLGPAPGITDMDTAAGITVIGAVTMGGLCTGARATVMDIRCRMADTAAGPRFEAGLLVVDSMVAVDTVVVDTGNPFALIKKKRLHAFIPAVASFVRQILR